MKIKIALLSSICFIVLYAQEINYKFLGPFSGLVGAVSVEGIKIHPINTSTILTLERSFGGVFISKNGSIVNLIDLKSSEIIPTAHFSLDDTSTFFTQTNGIIFKVNFDDKQISIIHQNNPDILSQFVSNPKKTTVIFNSRDGTKLYRSDDGGEQWYLISELPNIIEALAISPSDTSVLYAGIGGRVYRSSDSGINWEMMTQQDGYGLRKIMVNPYNKNTIYLIYKNNLYVSYNAGITLQPLLDINGVNTFVLNPIDTLKIYAVQGDPVFQPNGFVFRTTDGGSNWSIINNNLPGISVTPLTIAIDPIYPETLYVSNGSMGVFKSTNGGNSWEQTKIVGSSVNSLYLDPRNPEEIIAGSYGWGLLKTTDSGMNWFQPNIWGYYHHYVVRNISENPFNPGEFLVGSRYSVLRSTDRGNNWFDTGQLEGARVIQYHPTIENLVLATTIYPYAPSNDDTIWRSTNNGLSWEKIRVGLIEGYHFHPDNPNIIYGISKHMGRVLKSNDAGMSWEDKTNNLPNLQVETGQCLALDPFNPEIIYIGLRPDINEPGGLFKSTNGGESWIRIDSTLSQLDQWMRITSILSDKQKAGRFYVGMSQYNQPYTPQYSNGGLFLTEDYGKNWGRVYDGAVFSLYEDYQNPRNVYVNTKFGLLKFLDTLTVTSIYDYSSEEIPTEYKLFDNYPNPFNPTTVISWQSPVASHQTLKVYDILGNEVVTLVNEYREAGRHKIEFNASNLASGVYIYKLTAGSFVSSKKMMVIK
ncbi:Hypothetical protein IALB_0144 [Ignavibacterium album JCM 16511]|uniref:Secretion system C-terminal sorting domain-containing protein n=1 Tax=Ignavibacterium album (strain DSM 19864 / JCM 16511 / NBRC 101810 / Mat9-16) TaxID=945713 RepID=I0AFU9_IGNAJ|nr:Hypothetical protein IALB_0144 [Ignavibacterium album JCM 16511]